jgi:hypothetical protein
VPDTCPECGAPVPDLGSCRDHFHALLLLEAEIPGVGGSILHFYAVATYGLQHPDSMNYTAAALAGLRAAVADALDGRATPGQLRSRGRAATDGPVRVTRRAGDAEVPWRRGNWPMTIADVCTADTFGAYDTYEEYADRVVRWARSVRETLDADER